MLRKEVVEKTNFSGNNWTGSPMSYDEFKLVMSSNKRNNMVSSDFDDSFHGLGYISAAQVKRKQLLIASNNEANFEVVEYSVLLPDTGPSGSVNASAGLRPDAGRDSGYYEVIKETKKLIAKFERARTHWKLITGGFDIDSNTVFERFITYGRTMAPEKVKLWRIPSSDTRSMESFKLSMDFLCTFDIQSMKFNSFQQNTIVRTLRTVPKLELEEFYTMHNDVT